MDEKSVWLVIISAVCALLGRVLFDWLTHRPDLGPDRHLLEIKDILKERSIVFVEIEAKLTALKESTGRIEGRIDEALRFRRR